MTHVEAKAGGVGIDSFELRSPSCRLSSVPFLLVPFFELAFPFCGWFKNPPPPRQLLPLRSLVLVVGSTEALLCSEVTSFGRDQIDGGWAGIR